MAMMGGGGGSCDGLPTYTATRFGYARNGQAVTFVHDESWCWDVNNPTPCPVDGTYQITWAREFRYDGARSRYMNRTLNPSTLATIATTWSDYDGDEVYGDFTVASASPWTVTNTDKYEPGAWRKIGGVTDYLHNDMLGTLRRTTNASGGIGGSDVFTAFGERISGTSDRFGYVGAWGYQSNPEISGFPYLHVGARYYDPASGRFLQRDPIGIDGGINVFEYVESIPTTLLDPSGEFYLWPNRGIIRYGPSRPIGAPPSVRPLAFRYGTHNPHIWGWRGAGIFGGLCAVSAGTGIVAGRAIDNAHGDSNNGYRISDGLADILYRWIYPGSGYDPWG